MNNQLLLEKANAIGKSTLIDFLEIRFIEIGDDYIIAQMPVNEKTCQPNHILHGGASAALAETTGSIAATLLANPDSENYLVLGIDIIMNHVRGVELGKQVFAKATLIHKGKTLQHWDIKITDEDENLVSYGKHTTIITKKK
ncbi:MULTISPECIES: PaaI family thioesterase [unclassified Capnocytophaga]|jgi:esterase ydiI|uniref:PaaI family thioesterase n=1 Tax=unclassified Capnocytophaga TaxID=2640652 RepID=UPI000202FBB8|nr:MULTISPECIES: PaaI family thioesterase [unclassified Capnocytophaga]EGD33730.1 esterase YbdB [Capnocytophaga sp. oral taxon 338 str. F0234]MEB3004554.1 PaaI family thioesterase [Capnocytophaga sp. G2]